MRAFIIILSQLFLVSVVHSQDTLPRPRLFNFYGQISAGNNFFNSGQWIYSQKFAGSFHGGLEFDINTDYFRKKASAISWIINYQYQYVYEKFSFNTFYDSSFGIDFTHKYQVQRLIPSFSLKLRFNKSKYKYEILIGEVSTNNLYVKRKITVTNGGVDYFTKNNHSPSSGMEIIRSSIFTLIPIWLNSGSRSFIFEAAFSPFSSQRIQCGLSFILLDPIRVYSEDSQNISNYILVTPQQVESISFKKSCLLFKVQYRIR